MENDGNCMVSMVYKKQIMREVEQTVPAVRNSRMTSSPMVGSVCIIFL